MHDPNDQQNQQPQTASDAAETATGNVGNGGNSGDPGSAGSTENASRDGKSGGASRPDELWLLDALRRGDESAFLSLVTMHYAAMLRLAQMYVGTRAVAEEVIQETWLGVLQGLDRFEGRSSLKTWIFRILLNRARTRAQRENRSIPFSALAADSAPDEPAIDADSFYSPEDQYAGMWITSPTNWEALPEDRLLSRETRQQIDAALTTLPPAQREVITLRDIDGWSASEVCDYLGISEANQRVLLHRARTRVRHALAGYLDDDENAS